MSSLGDRKARLKNLLVEGYLSNQVPTLTLRSQPLALAFLQDPIFVKKEGLEGCREFTGETGLKAQRSF